MIKLEIQVQPKSNKYLEFSQSLNLMKADLIKICPDLSISEKNKTFSLISIMNSSDQLKEVLNSKEFSILSGAIKTLGEKSDITIQGVGYKIKESDLKEIRLKYSIKTKLKNKS